MDQRKDMLSSLKICRFCLTQEVPLASIYDKKRKLKNGVNLPLKILSCVSVEVFPSDKMPSYICERCRYFMNICYDFKQICRQADESILHYIQDSLPLKSVTWPASLKEAYTDSNDIGVVKTVVEDGTTVQITHDMSDSEDEEEENLYNVKVNDGSDEVSKTFVKVVASRDNGENKEAKRNIKEAEDRCWPCDQCNCSYPFQQLLELHIMRKHRERTIECDQCDAKFFSKNDLAIHQLRHSEEMPFLCSACGKRFRRQILLNRHVKTKHADLMKHACTECPAVFISQEELDTHGKKHEQQPALLKCTMCDKKMYPSSMQRHIQSVHERIENFYCDYCPQRFPTTNKLLRHIRTHAGDKPYTCKYCDKTFAKSHHVTRHQRYKHTEEYQKGLIGQSEQLRCEQCEESFNNQDELIYHSAIHATQNLTCPLCQEKFHNVDAVTTHIKSHVNGVEFMCEFCELVFTSKEKLDGHMERAHEDELQQELSQENQDDSSNEMDNTGMEGDEEEESINVQEEDDHMVVEIKKAGDFIIKKAPPSVPAEEAKPDDSSHSEGESGSETEYVAAPPMPVEQLAIVKKISPKPAPKEPVKPVATTSAQVKPVVQAKPSQDQAVLIQKNVVIKRASPAPGSPASSEKKEKPVMAQVTKIENSNDKSLRLLEKELQDLKRTNSRTEAVKTPVNTPRPKGRPPLHSSTPKPRPVEEKKIQAQVVSKSPVPEKKLVEKKITKENKEPKEVKEIKINNKEEKDNGQKNNKSIIKNGTTEKTGFEDGVRRSTRPSKIKDYAKMIRVNTQDDSDDSDELADDDEEYKEGDKTTEVGRVKARRSSVRPGKGSPAPAPSPAAPAASPAAPPRKRGRPRKEPPPQDPPAKVSKTESEPAQEKAAEVEEKQDPEPELEPEGRKDVEEPQPSEEESRAKVPRKTQEYNKDVKDDEVKDASIPEADPPVEKITETKEDSFERRILPVPYQITYDPGPSTSNAKIITPIVPSLKKVPIRSLPPGVKPMPLPLGRSIPSGELCEMQIGKKVVKVQKIVMTKAEVEAMAKQGLVEMKDGTMVLKQGIKLPKVETVKTGAGETEKESPIKKDKAVPTRCVLDDE